MFDFICVNKEAAVSLKIISIDASKVQITLLPKNY
jgi:hypothetical protein